MDKKSVADTLLEMAKSEGEKSASARLREIEGEIEIALAAGVSRARVVQALRENGIAMAPGSFNTLLSRIRRRRKLTEHGANASAVSTKSPTTVKAIQPAQPSQTRQLNNPADLRQAMKRDVDLSDYTDSKDD